ncbi:MAG: phosphotransferase family protein [Cyclobacteriaceae bacterium]|nr:phosphotransferase family protein [Cyclobacteriaceae bacterium]MCH8516347.1 phosphotransferase family protein [Cyclobacteriaceae bacterium]
MEQQDKSQLIDHAQEVRTGELPDLQVLGTYLAKQVDSFSDKINIQQFPGGFSNLTYLIESSGQEYVLRRPPIGANVRGGHDMEREFKVLKALEGHFDKIPKAVFYCGDEDVIGAPFYVMERVKGVILRNKVPKGLHMSADDFSKLSRKAIDQLADLHKVDLDKTGLNALGKGEGYTERQVKGWIKRYYNAATDKLADMDNTASWLESNIPADSDSTFIHNDFKYDNLVLNPSNIHEILAVLDWEMATVGDPLMDLGTSLAYWTEEGDENALKPFNISWMPGNMSRQEVATYYAEQSGRKLTHLPFYYAFGCFKVGVICQQIYARFVAGKTKDPRFGALIYVIKACGRNAQKAIASGKI